MICAGGLVVSTGVNAPPTAPVPGVPVRVAQPVQHEVGGVRDAVFCDEW